MLKALTELPQGKLRLTIALLLTLNAFLYAALDSLISAVDAFAWLALLLSFELETAGLPAQLSETRLHLIRNGILVIIVLVTFAYLLTGDLLNISSELLWLGLIGLLEMEVRTPSLIEQHQRLYWLASVIVFVGLIAMVGISAWMGAVLDAYNNLLWIIAFALVEVDLFRFLKFRRH